MIFGSVCSGIEAASVAWYPLGWRAAFYSEIDPFPRAVLKHHYPEVPLHGDFTTIEAGQYAAIDVLVGGTPCQDFSVAGNRAGLGGERGDLTLEYARLAYRLGSRWLAWENVPGTFSNNKGRDFGAVLACFAGYPAGTIFEPPSDGWKSGGIVSPAGPGCYGLAWRVLDAQYFGVPQRRRRIFLVGYIGDWRPAAAVLFERHSLSGNPAPSRSAEKGFAADVVSSLTASGRGVERTGETRGKDPVVAVPMGLGDDGQTARALNACPTASGRLDASVETFIQQPVPILEAGARTGKSTDDPRAGIGIGDPGDPIFTLQAGKQHAVAFTQNQRDEVRLIGGNGKIVGAIASDVGTHQQAYIAFKVSHFTRGKDGAPSDVTPPLSADADKGDQDTLIAFDCKAGGKTGLAIGNQVGALRGEGHGGGHAAIAFTAKDYGGDAGDLSPTLRAMEFDKSHANGGGQVAVAFESRFVRNGRGAPSDVVPPLKAQSGETGKGDAAPLVITSGVRRLTPRECERLQSFPDDYTLVPYRGKPAADGPRYRSLGNSMNANVMRWLGERIAMVEAIVKLLEMEKI